MLHVAWKRGLPRNFARFVLFRPVKKRSFDPLCVWDLCVRHGLALSVDVRFWNWTCCQPHRVNSGRSHTATGQIHILKLFYYVKLYQRHIYKLSPNTASHGKSHNGPNNNNNKNKQTTPNKQQNQLSMEPSVERLWIQSDIAAPRTSGYTCSSPWRSPRTHTSGHSHPPR